jgi:hypothetical protein
MDNVQKHYICINVPSSQHFTSYLHPEYFTHLLIFVYSELFQMLKVNAASCNGVYSE